jgi:hypothetical protein
MESTADFIFDPLPPIDEPDASGAAGEPAAFAAAAEPAEHPLGLLTGLRGTWIGEGFNVIWRPHHPTHRPLVDDHVLELNLTSERLDFGPGLGKIPNRGLRQRNIGLHGLNYLQQISDASVSHEHHHDSKQHFEPGLWLRVPGTTHPEEPQTVARLACIPHGTVILAQGTADTSDGDPDIPRVSIRPFFIGHPGNEQDVLEQHVDFDSDFRIPRHPLQKGIKQELVDNPNSFLIPPPFTPHLPIAKTTKLHVSTRGSLPGGGTLPGGGAANIAFLKGGPDGPNAVTTRVTATFWLQTVQGDTEPSLLQYSQRVLLDFNGVSWPHVTVATLHKQAPNN